VGHPSSARPLLLAPFLDPPRRPRSRALELTDAAPPTPYVPCPPPVCAPRWFGPVAFDRLDIDYVGVHLDRPRGRHGGTVGGISYFDAEPGAAEFVRASTLVPGSGGAPGGNTAAAAAAESPRSGGRTEAVAAGAE
jgi:hypothetical protein